MIGKQLKTTKITTFDRRLIGKKVYKIEGAKIISYIILNVDNSNRIVIKREKDDRIFTPYFEQFQSYYSVSKMFLLRRLVLTLEEELEKAYIEINEYELKCIMDRYKI